MEWFRSLFVASHEDAGDETERESLMANAVIEPQQPEVNLSKLHPLERPPLDAYDDEGLGDISEERPVAPDQFLEGFESSRREIWSYYIYYIGNTGLGLFQFAPTAFQNLLSQAAGDEGVLYFCGSSRTINSIVLLSNGISFSIQMALFLIIGSLADFGTWRPYILIVQTVIAIAIGYAWLGVHTAEKWEYAVGLYIVGLIAYQLAYAYWLAAFPGLARNTPTLREHARKLNSGQITRDEYDAVDSQVRNKICNMGLYVSGAGEIPLVAIGIGILYAVHSNDNVANNNWGLSVLIAWSSTFWLVLALPWFFLEKKRPGQPLPPGKNIFTAGLWQIYRAGMQVWKLRQTLAYLIGFFLLGDTLNTTVTVIGTLQNEVQAYNTVVLCELLIVGLIAQTVGIYVYMQVQQRWRLGTKTMFMAVAFSTIALDLYGMVGIWTRAIGFHNKWEFWVYQTWYGLMVCPWYSYSQTMVSEVTPRGKEFLFFSLFNIVGKASSFIGPLISSAIIDAVPSHNNSTPFYFLAGLSALSTAVVYYFVDLPKSRDEQERFLEDERKARRALEAASS